MPTSRLDTLILKDQKAFNLKLVAQWLAQTSSLPTKSVSPAEQWWAQFFRLVRVSDEQVIDGLLPNT
jgi:hypothetical protein